MHDGYLIPDENLLIFGECHVVVRLRVLEVLALALRPIDAVLGLGLGPQVLGLGRCGLDSKPGCSNTAQNVTWTIYKVLDRVSICASSSFGQLVKGYSFVST